MEHILTSCPKLISLPMCLVMASSVCRGFKESKMKLKVDPSRFVPLIDFQTTFRFHDSLLFLEKIGTQTLNFFVVYTVEKLESAANIFSALLRLHLCT